MGRILVVDDQPSVRRVLTSSLRQDRHETWEASDVEEARHRLTTNQYDAVFTAHRMPDGKGQTVFMAARDSDLTLSVVFLATAVNIGPDVDLRDSGVDFLARPFRSELVRATAHRACERTRLCRENLLLKKMIPYSPAWPVLSGESPAIQEVKRQIALYAPSNACVLVTGEIGTGKESAAREIHRSSPRALKPFVVVNCTSAEPQLERELFGSAKDASAGDGRSRRGLFETAHEGTVFLDEVAEILPATQSRLLRILADGHLFRVGSTHPRAVDVRVLVGTRHDLERRAREGLFRADLFRLLAMVPLHLPPLRDRCEDIPGLCKMFSGQVAAELNLPYKRIVDQAVENLKSYQFPGNLRELRNLIEHAYMLSTHNKIAPADLRFLQERKTPPPVSHNLLDRVSSATGSLRDSFDLPALLEQTEKELIVRTLDATGGAQAEAARRMGLPRSVLAYKLNKYKLRFQSGSGPKNPPA